MRNRIITLTTDFGYKDPFVAEMKGVILSVNPDVTLVDVTHSIQPQDIEEAAYVIGSSYSYFPAGTIHIVVVDPGVGSERKALVLQAGKHFFVGPDNGVFSHILNKKADDHIHQITEEKYMRPKDSHTFQGRDLFAPVAAWLSKGLPISEFGPSVEDLVTLPIAQPLVTEGRVHGEVIYIDSFGNAIANITRDDLARLGVHYSVEINNKVVRKVQYYAQADENSLSCLVNSSDHLELFVKNGNGAKEFNLTKGFKVTVVK
ncbi:MAG: SAM-dependent chlorinase/fluorinase [Nitrospirae bacterium]|nr:SAM-dependent chlorinase/fluorinase [Nitrospirota bacterium]